MLRAPVRRFRLPIIFLGGAALFWMLRPLAIQSGDWKGYYYKPIYGSSRPLYHVREPGAVFMWQALAWTVHALDPESIRGDLAFEQRHTAFSILGALSGGLYLAFVVGFLMEIRERVDGRFFAALAIVLVSSMTWNFVGHIEFYAPLLAALALFYWMMVRYYRQRTYRRFVALFLSAVAAVLVHRVSLFHLPAMALLYRSREGRWRRPSAREARLVLAVIVAVCVTHLIPVLLYMIRGGPFLVLETNNWALELLTPWTQGWADYVSDRRHLEARHLFLFGRPDHWKHFFFFMGVGSPLGVVLCLVWIRRIRAEHEKFLALAAASIWLWALFWHPHISYQDWDLFSIPALPANLLAAALLLGRARSSPPSEEPPTQ